MTLKKNSRQASSSSLKQSDPQIFAAIQNEAQRQKNGLELIASENYTSPAVLSAGGSILTNKYAEGYPGKRYYGGCEFVDVCETLAINRAKLLFSAEHANVQPHSGSQANMAVFLTAAKPGDKIMGMSLSHGGHLTHGAEVNFSGSVFRSCFYGTDPKTGLIDYNQVEDTAKKQKPQILIAGYSAYPRLLNFKAFRDIARQVNAVFVVDMAHFAGLTAGGVHPSPIPYADFVTSTTHKTLRGPRGGLILCSKENSQALNKSIFPGIQGGPLMHIIAGKAAAFHEALQSSFKIYAQNTVNNAKILSEALLKKGFSLVTGGTDNHLILIALKNITGKQAETALQTAGITVNKNTVPGETRPPWTASGIRIGTPAVTTRGMGPAEMEQIAVWIDQALQKPHNHSHLTKISQEVKNLCSKFYYPCSF